MEVHYPKELVLDTWLNTSIAQRQQRLTYRHSVLVGAIQALNFSLSLKQTMEMEAPGKTFPVLESMETCWTDPVYIQIKEKMVKGRGLVQLLEERGELFLEGKKVLYREEGDWAKFFAQGASTWEQFEQMIITLLEQSFLKTHYDKCELEASKTALVLMSPQKPTDKKKKKRPTQPFCQYDRDNLVIDLCSETSTDTDLDPADYLLEASISGSRSYHIRRKYMERKLEISAEMLAIIREELSEVHIDWEDLDAVGVVQDYYSQHTPALCWRPSPFWWRL